jgi:hypothetical protein
METKQTLLPLALAALGIIGTLLAGSMQHLWVTREKQDQAFEERRRTAYVEFLRALDKPRVADMQNAEADSLLADAEKEKKHTRRAKDLRNKAQALREEARNLKKEFEQTGGAAVRLIAIYGDKAVVEAYANYSRALDIHSKGKEAYGPCSTTWREDVAIYQAIRKSSMGPNQEVKPEDLAFSALFCDPAKPAGAQQRVPAEAQQAAPR